MLNKRQRKIIVVGVVVIMMMGIFPPWKLTLNSHKFRDQEPAGYRLLINPPESEGWYSAEIDLTRLLVQWILVVIGTGLAVFLTGNKD